MRAFYTFLLVAVLATVSQGAFIFDLTSIDGAGCVFDVKSTSAISGYDLGIKAINGDISTSGISWPNPPLFDVPGGPVASGDYDYAFSASQIMGGPVGAATLIFGIGFVSESVPYTIELYDSRVSKSVPVDTITYNVPEPAMVSLMALGCLGLKRRKKS
jgi:hypothetical protein